MLRRQTYFATPQTVPAKSWHTVDAAGVPLGRLSTEIAQVLMGKHRPEYTPHVDCGDFVIVLNAEKVVLTGNKATQKTLQRYSRYPGGLKEETYERVLNSNHPERLIEQAVKRMLPKNRIGRHMLTKLKVYAGAEHPHQSQQPVPMAI